MAVKTYSLKKNGNQAVSAHFKVNEFRCKNGSDTVLIDEGLVTILERIRSHFNASIHINSAYRPAAYNRKVGGAKSSQHIKGTAADIVVHKRTPLEVARFAESIGVGGIGVYNSFTHVDNRAGKARWGFRPQGSVPVKSFGAPDSSTAVPVSRQVPPNEDLELIPENWLPQRPAQSVPVNPILDDKPEIGALEVFYEDRVSHEQYKLVVLDDCTLAHTFDLKPSTFKFSVIDDYRLTLNEGAAILVKDHGIPIFKGYIFSHEYDESGIIKVTAYDQLRYFSYQDTYIYSDQSAGDILNKWATYFGLKTGTVETDSFRIVERDEWGKSIAEMLDYALLQTIIKTGQTLAVYDDAGELNLRYASDLHFSDYFIKLQEATSFKVTRSIDGDSYNQIKLIYKNEEAGTFETYQAHDSDNIGKWGLLQYYEEVQDQARAQSYAEQMLRSKNVIRNTLNLKEIPSISAGHIRAGMSISAITLDGNTMTPLLVLAVTHTWVKGRHLMDFNLYAE